MALVRLTRQSVAIAAIATGLALASCKHQDPQPAQAPYGYPYPAQYPAAPPPAPWAPQPAYYGPSAPPAITPAFGFYCQTDGDLQCAYGHCINGHCGGCSDMSQCKRGSVCAPSPVGGTCWPDLRQSPQPQPQPPPSPGPTPTQPPGFPVPPSTPPGPSSDPFASARQSCVDRINQYRSRVGVGPIARDPSTEACDDDESRLDAGANRAHGSFGKCGERAQNACPNYPGASVEDVLTKCLQQMFEEGPGGGHYDNMTSTKYSRASCGFVPVGGGRIWTVQNFFK